MTSTRQEIRGKRMIPYRETPDQQSQDREMEWRLTYLGTGSEQT